MLSANSIKGSTLTSSRYSVTVTLMRISTMIVEKTRSEYYKKQHNRVKISWDTTRYCTCTVSSGKHTEGKNRSKAWREKNK